MQRNTYSDLALGLCAAGVPSYLVVEHLPIRHTADVAEGIARFQQGEMLDALTADVAEALADALALLSDSALAKALQFDLSGTVEADILSEALENEAQNRDEADYRASHAGTWEDDEDSLDETTYDVEDWDDEVEVGSDWDDEEVPY